MERVHARYIRPGVWATDAQLLRQAEQAFLTAVAQAFGRGRWQVGQLVESPATRVAVALLAEARGWNYATAPHLGRALTDLRDRGAPLLRDPRGGQIFWRLTEDEPTAPPPPAAEHESEPAADGGSGPEPLCAQARRRPSARHGAQPSSGTNTAPEAP